MAWADNPSDWSLFFEMLSPGPGESVLDVGAGRGTIASRVRGGPERPDVWVVEPVKEKLRRAHDDHPELRALIGAAELLPFPNAYFDKVYATLSTHHFDDIPGALHEIARVMKTGAKFVVLEVDPHSARGLLFRVVGRITRERMHLMTPGRLAEAVGSTDGLKVTRVGVLGSFHLLQATRV